MKWLLIITLYAGATTNSGITDILSVAGFRNKNHCENTVLDLKENIPTESKVVYQCIKEPTDKERQDRACGKDPTCLPGGGGGSAPYTPTHPYRLPDGYGQAIIRRM